MITAGGEKLIEIIRHAWYYSVREGAANGRSARFDEVAEPIGCGRLLFYVRYQRDQ